VSTYGTGTYGAGTYGTLSGVAPAALPDPGIIFEVAFADNPGANLPTFVGLDSRLAAFTIARGRQMELDAVETGQLAGTLRNQDRHLDPLYTSSPYYPNVVPIRQSRLRVSATSTTYDVFRGDVQDWPQEWDVRENTVPVEVLDAFGAVADAQFTASRPAELSGARINAILDAISWPAVMRSINTGQSMMRAIDYENANAKTEMQTVARSEQGVLFVNAAGVIVFHERYRRYRAPYNVSTVTFSNQPTGGELPLSDATPVYRQERIKNHVVVTSGDVSFEATDATSSSRFRKRSLTVDTILDDPDDVAAMAAHLLSRYKDPEMRIEEVVLEPQQDTALWAHCLGREIGDEVTTIVRPPGTPAATVTTAGIIERVEHSFSTPTKRWVTKFRLSPADQTQYWLAADATYGLAGTTTRAVW
jgi:hypothetical protein